METAHSGFVQPWSTQKRPIYDEECSLQTQQPVADSSLTSDLYSEEFDKIEMNIAENEPELDVNTTNSDVKSLNYSHSEERTPWFRPPIPTAHPTAGRSLQHVVWHERSEDEMWSPFQNKRDFELPWWFIEAKVPKDYMDRYFKKALGPEGSSITALLIGSLKLVMSWSQEWVWRAGKKGLYRLAKLYVDVSLQRQLLSENRKFRTEKNQIKLSWHRNSFSAILLIVLNIYSVKNVLLKI